MSGNSNLLCAHCMQAREYLMSAGRRQSLSFPWIWPNPLKSTSGFRDRPREVHTGNPSWLVRALVPQLTFPLVFCLPLRLCQDVHLECWPLPTYPSLTLPSRPAQSHRLHLLPLRVSTSQQYPIPASLFSVLVILDAFVFVWFYPKLPRLGSGLLSGKTKVKTHRGIFSDGQEIHR